jgi:hypothetical protein
VSYTAADITELDDVQHTTGLVHYPPTPAISALLHRLKGRTGLRHTARGHRPLCPRPHVRTPLVPVLLRCLLRRRTIAHHQAVHRRPAPL